MYFYLMFLPFSYIILCNSSVTLVKKRNFMSEGEKYSVKLHGFFSYFMSDGYIFYESHDLSKWNHNEYKKHLICYNAFQSSFKLILSVFKKNWKNNYNCPFDMCLSYIITSSRISLIVKNCILLSSFDRIKKSILFFWSYYSI